MLLRLTWITSVTLLAAAAIACGGASVKRGTSPEEVAEAKRDAERESKKLTLAKYHACKEGMSYDEVVKVVGFHGEEMSRNSIGGLTTVLFMWKGDFGANMNATFQNDQLVSKAQFGLK